MGGRCHCRYLGLRGRDGVSDSLSGFQVLVTDICVTGLRCPEKLKRGTFIELYLGEVIGPAEATARAALGDKIGESYLYDLDKFTFCEDDLPDELSVGMESDHNDHYTIDGRFCGSVARFINHSCDPNLDTYAVAGNRRDYKVYDLAFFTSRDVAPYEELCFSYTYWVPTVKGSKQEEEEGGWPCHCGADNCVQRLWA
jgi:histone-lysine N-methyltransferase SUV39H